MQTPTRRFPVQSITLHRAEGSRSHLGAPYTVATYQEADQILRGWAWSAPATGGYDKCDFTILFADGMQYQGRYDVQHPSLKSPSLLHHLQHRLRAPSQHQILTRYDLSPSHIPEPHPLT